MRHALRLTAPILVVAALAAAAATASAQSGAGPMWASVNICNGTQAGMRASMAGDGSDAEMQVRFTAQYYNHEQDAWLSVAGAATSPWLPAGSARYEWGQAGWTFNFNPPAPGTSFVIRGLAEMQWVKGGQLVRSASQVTSAAAGQASCLFQG